MKHFLVILIFLICLGLDLRGQDVEVLPDDPRVKKGTLANGLSYILIKNKDVKGYAHFGVAQKVGTTLEEKSQKGMFEMLETLTVKGTRNFTDSTITQYLKSIGLRTEDVSFATNEDDITYLIKNVPVTKGNSVDSSLLILYNWLGSINIDEEDIKEEIPFVKNRLLYEWDAEKRLNSRLLEELYPGSGYANFNYSDIDGIDKFTSKDLRNFYYKWFRPDFQAIVVVGDIDLSLIETKVKSIFVTIPKPLEKQKRGYYKPEPFDGVKVCILKDKEYDKTKVSINILKEPLLAKYKLTSVPYIQEYMDHAISRLLSGRLKDGIINNNLPITNLEITKGPFMNLHEQDAFSITFETLPDMIYSSIGFVNAEIGKMAKYGFNSQEFGKSKDIYYRELENIYDNRMRMGNDAYLQRALDHYYRGASLASVELKFEIIKQILFTITLNQFNGYAKALLGQTDNIVISCMMPEYEGIESITPDRVMAAYRDAGLKTPAMEFKAPVVIWPQFADQKNTVSHLLSETPDPVTGATVFTLSNGATVILKNTEIDTISFRAVSKGGYSLMRGINAGNADYVNDILNLGGLGNFSQPNIERLFSYNNISLKAKLLQQMEILEGYSNTTGIEKLLHAIYWSFTERRADEAAFDIYKKRKIYEAAYRSLSPSNAFKDSILHYNYSNKNYIKGLGAGEVSSLQYPDLLQQLRRRFSNAADFIFVFVGNINKELFKELVIKYIGSIPGNVSKKEEWQIVPNYLTKGHVGKRFLYRMINPRTYSNITYSLGMEYNLKNYVLGDLLEAYLAGVLDERGTRKFTTRSKLDVELSNYPEKILKVNINFETDSLSAQIVDNIVEEAMKGAAGSAFTQDDLEKLRKEVMQEYMEKSKGNDYWLDIMEKRYIANEDIHHNYVPVLEGITVDDFKKIVSDIINGGNKITVIMDGTVKDVNTQNLFKEDAFIKDFFNVN